MLLNELEQRLTLNVIESTISDENFISFNYYMRGSTLFDNVLYFPLDDDVINDEVHAFLFINHKPKGTYKKYVLIQSDQDPFYLISQIQNQFISSLALSNNLAKLATIGTSENSLENLLKMASNLVNNPIVLCNTAYEVIYAWDNNVENIGPFWNQAIKTGFFKNNFVDYFEQSGITKKVRTQNEPVLWNFADSINHPDMLTQRVMGEKGIIGYVSFFLVSDGSFAASFEILKQLSEMLPQMLVDTSVLVKTYIHLQKVFLNHLINGEFTDTDNLDFYLENIQYKKHKFYRLIFLSLEKNSPLYNTDFYLKLVATPDIIGTTYNGKMVLLAGYDENFQSVMDFISSVFEKNPFKYFVSLEFENILHTDKIMRIMNAHYKTDKKISYLDDYLLVKHVPISNLFNSTYETLFACPNGMELIHTLAVYIENNMNVTDCAKALYIHRNTLMYRLERIRTEGNIDLDHYLELMNFYIYYCVKNNLL